MYNVKDIAVKILNLKLTYLIMRLLITFSVVYDEITF